MTLNTSQPGFWRWKVEGLRGWAIIMEIILTSLALGTGGRYEVNFMLVAFHHVGLLWLAETWDKGPKTPSCHFMLGRRSFLTFGPQVPRTYRCKMHMNGGTISSCNIVDVKFHHA
jgi:hypothetical protein